MDLTGKYEIPASPEAVWEALNDPEVLKTCLPGCEAVEKTSPTEFLATATLKIGPMKATFKGKVALTELDPPRRCVVRGEGQGGAAGFAKGEAEVLLTPNGNGTTLTYAAKASIGGKLAQIGQRLIDGAARQIADDFFGRFASTLTQRQSDVVEEHTTSSAAEAVGRRAEKWAVGLVAAAAAIAAFLLLLFMVLR